MKKQGKLKKALQESLIVSALDRFSRSVSGALAGGFFGYIFSGGEGINRRFGEGFFASWGNRRGENSSLRRGFARVFEESAAMRILSSAAGYFLGCTLRNYALFFMTFGAYTVVAALLKYFTSPGGELDWNNLYFGAVTAISVIPMLFFRITAAEAVQRSKIAGWFFIHALGIPAERFEERHAKYGGRSNVAFIAGMLGGAATYYIPPLLIPAAIAAAVFLYIVFSMPETGIVFILFLLPYLVILPRPSITLAALVLLCTAAYTVKLIRGKRVFAFALSDFAALLFLALLFMGGIISFSPSESVKITMIYCCFMLGYFLTVNLMRTGIWLRRAVISLVSSSVIVSAYGIFQKFTGSVDNKWIDTNMFAEIGERVVSTFENPNMLAQYLILCLPFAAALFFTSKKASARGGALIACTLIGVCLIYTWSRGAWLGAIIGMAVFLVILSRKTWTVFAAALLAVPFLPLVLPESIISRFTSIGNLADSSTSYRVYIWRAAIRMIGDFFGSGIGVGEDAFSQAYSLYAFSGIEAAPHSHNLYFQIIIELGAVGLIVFMAAVFLFMQTGFRLIKQTESAGQRMMCAAGMCGILAALAQGATEYIWYNYRVFFMFWAVIGLSAAYSRLGGNGGGDYCLPYGNGSDEAALEFKCRGEKQENKKKLINNEKKPNK